MQKLIGFVILLALPILYLNQANASLASTFDLSSPNGHIQIKIQAGERISYDIAVNGKTVIRNATFSLDIDHTNIGANPKVDGTKNDSVERDIQCPVPQKSAKIHEAYKELRLEMAGNYAIVFRAYNEGVAYRFETALPQNAVKVYNEDVSLNFAGDYNVYYPKEESFFSHNEREFLYVALKDIPATSIASLPAVVDTRDGVKLIIGESDVEDYPGLWLHGNSNNNLSGTFPHYPLKEDARNDRDIKVAETADYIADTKGTRTFPWRILGIAENDGALITNQLVYLLAKPSQVQDTSWIKPGKVAWDWYNANNIWGVDFKSGINTQTYKYYIDFASKYGIEYIILDEGWYKLGNVLQVVPEMNVEELVAYGKQKNVGIILWVIWKTLDNQFDAAFEQYSKWGIKGLKIDFMQRDDQPVMNFYQRVLREAAKRKMLVDFHGGIRPATMTRTWPNLINTEGVRGLEQNKWSKYSNPEHNVTLPFTRMFLGPLDYTPGAMVNSGLEKNFQAVFERPMSLGTRCHQLAMYVVYEAPLQMLADSPSRYLREPEIMQLLAPMPTTWDETKVLDAKMGDYVVIARRHGRDWYIGAMTDWEPRDLNIDLSFLPAGNFEMDAYQDGANADRLGSDYKKVTSTVTNKSKVTIKMARGGGWAARIVSARG
ncbi:MAG TPA: glycoside hydrolase family 97 protein [Pyrinomonadaceae bacterium]|jgi:Glycoside hydrolase 97.|nr:glycoside hydrolase family 97 protein [Pyrinomonadaceae bacterium]